MTNQSISRRFAPVALLAASLLAAATPMPAPAQELASRSPAEAVIFDAFPITSVPAAATMPPVAMRKLHGYLEFDEMVEEGPTATDDYADVRAETNPAYSD